MKKLLLSIMAVMLFCSAGAPAFARGISRSLTENAPLLQGPATTEIITPYDEALQCLSDKLTPEQKAVTYGVVYFADKTGKTNIAATDAAGAFMSQGYDDALVTFLKKTGVRVANVSPAFRQLLDWQLAKANLTRNQEKQVNLLMPDVFIEGGFNVLDVDPGNVAEITGSVQLGHREHRMLIGFDSNATAALFNQINRQPGETVTSFGYTKQIVGTEDQFGLTSFFLGGALRSVLGFNLDKAKNEPLQYGGRVMMAVVAWRTVRDISGNTACDDAFTQAETQAHVATLDTRGKPLVKH